LRKAISSGFFQSQQKPTEMVTGTGVRHVVFAWKQKSLVNERKLQKKFSIAMVLSVIFTLQQLHKRAAVYKALYAYVKIVYDTNPLSLRNSRMRGTDAEQAFQGQGWPLEGGRLFLGSGNLVSSIFTYVYKAIHDCSFVAV